jgi:ribonuclease BN (tRNA processing enzyme)
VSQVLATRVHTDTLAGLPGLLLTQKVSNEPGDAIKASVYGEHTMGGKHWLSQCWTRGEEGRNADELRYWRAKLVQQLLWPPNSTATDSSSSIMYQTHTIDGTAAGSRHQGNLHMPVVLAAVLIFILPAWSAEQTFNPAGPPGLQQYVDAFRVYATAYGIDLRVTEVGECDCHACQRASGVHA